MDPRTELCAARGERDCDGPIPPDNLDVCRWVQVHRYPAGATTCDAEADVAGRCVAFRYYGDGCLVNLACAGTQEGLVYHRFDGACGSEVFLARVCGYLAVDWEACMGRGCSPDHSFTATVTRAISIAHLAHAQIPTLTTRHVKKWRNGAVSRHRLLAKPNSSNAMGDVPGAVEIRSAAQRVYAAFS